MRQAQPLIDAWSRFWFSPADPTLLGLVRILSGLMLLYTHAVWGLELDAFFGPNGWQSSELVHALQREQFAYSFWWWVPGSLIHVAHWAAMLVLALFTVGLFTEVTGVLACVIAISYAHRAPAAQFGLDQINTMLALYLAIGASGRALSLDRLFVRYRKVRRVVEEGFGRIDFTIPPNMRANLGLRLIQVHMCVIYFFAGISKLQGTAWWNGEAMWLAFSNLEYQSADMTWLAHFPWLINLITHVSVLFEISFCALVWNRNLRPVVLALAVVLHFGIGATLGMWTFGLVMLIGCTAFVPPALLQRLKRLLRPADRPDVRIVRYDPDCIGCRREAVLIKTLDVFDEVRLLEVRRPAADIREIETTGQKNGWRRFSSWGHLHPAQVQTAGGNGTAHAQDSPKGMNGSTDHSQGPLVVCIQSRARQQIGEYLSSKSYRILEAENVEQGLTLARLSSPDCVIVLGHGLAADDLAGFQNQVAEIDDKRIASMIVLTPGQREMQSQLRTNDLERILVQPVSLRQVRVEMESALNCRMKAPSSSPLEAADEIKS